MAEKRVEHEEHDMAVPTPTVPVAINAPGVVARLRYLTQQAPSLRWRPSLRAQRRWDLVFDVVQSAVPRC
ncbi:hypothetical protein [Gordonia rhizosphera]|uniref:Uncharacterized protein n=1 Tax=Gordonia rhizosphera NBRC 16068 TaxID=1108045 RepID=K6V4S5_9ACTN|nr:hypothetical protein [Gordonia rhizosphera]GAB91178.1 hypothetical protein GORHZ_125_00610 [Gordonia rhizosphera NBRC 16068]